MCLRWTMLARWGHQLTGLERRDLVWIIQAVDDIFVFVDMFKQSTVGGWLSRFITHWSSVLNFKLCSAT
jgi:hypothetical protein